MYKKIITYLVVITFLFNPVFILAQTADQENQAVKDINKQIQEKQDQIKKIQEKQEAYSKAIRQKQSEKATLSNQLSILQNHMAKAALDIETTQTEIDRTNLEIEKVNLDIGQKDQEINKEKDHIASIIRLMQKEDDKPALKVLLLNGTLNDYLSQIRYLEDINKEVGESLDDLKQLKADLESRKKDLSDKGRELSGLKLNLENKKVGLAVEQENKTNILEQTRSSEREYQRLLNQARREQEQAQADIVSLERAVRSRLEKISGKDLEFNDSGLIWPVSKNLIVASFHDPDYPFRYIFEHPAVDIRAAQGSTIRAAASGYVAIAKDAGMGYSYIMIVHGDGLATVYGHVSKIYVSPDEYVVQGQAIGLTGGTPGTRGAGPLTTGPHIHFEVRLNGVPVDPEEYLP